MKQTLEKLKLILLTLFFTLTMNNVKAQNDDCSQKGTLFNQSDDCGIQILTNYGELLSIRDWNDSIPYEDSLTIEFDYYLSDTLTTICGSNFTVNLTCLNVVHPDTIIPPVDTTFCKAFFSYEELNNAIIDSVYPDTGYFSQTYQFYDLSKGNPIKWEWDFGDGTASTLQNPQHSYLVTDNYEVTLQISNALGCTDSYSITIVMLDTTENCEAYFEYEPMLTTANDTINPDTGYFYPTVQFYDYTKGNPVKWEWDFGDGTTSCLQNPSHSFKKLGIYEVCLTIVTKSGCESSYCKTLDIVNSDCETSFTYELIGNRNTKFKSYKFRPIFSDKVDNVEWYIDGERIRNVKQPVYHFENSGLHTICLNVRYIDGCESNFCDSLLINLDPTNRNPEHVDSLDKRKNGIEVGELYPLPANNEISIMVKSNQEQTINIEIISLYGQKKVVLDNYELVQGDNLVSMQLDNLAKGTYLYRISSGQNVKTGKILIVR